MTVSWANAPPLQINFDRTSKNKTNKKKPHCIWDLIWKIMYSVALIKYFPPDMLICLPITQHQWLFILHFFNDLPYKSANYGDVHNSGKQLNISTVFLSYIKSAVQLHL